jgi:hypothetical protein
LKFLKNAVFTLSILIAGLTINMNKSQAYWWFELWEPFPWLHWFHGEDNLLAVWGGSGGGGSCPPISDMRAKCQVSNAKTEAEFIKFLKSKGYTKLYKPTAAQVSEMAKPVNKK